MSDTPGSLIVCTVQVWDCAEEVPHEVSSRVYLRLNFKLHIYFAVRKITSGTMTVPDCLTEVWPSVTLAMHKNIGTIFR